MEKDESEIEVGSDLGSNSTRQEKTSQDSLAEVCRYERINLAIKEGKPCRVDWELVPMRTLELMRKRGLLILRDEEEKADIKRRRVEPVPSSDLNETAEEIVLPFTKTVASWKELDEVYKRRPQRPHFRPLFYSDEYSREWVATIVTQLYIHVLKTVDDMGEDTTLRDLDMYTQTIDLLEDYGLDLKVPLSRINELLSVKNGLPIISEEQKGIDKEMTGESSKEAEAEQESGEVQKHP